MRVIAKLVSYSFSKTIPNLAIRGCCLREISSSSLLVPSSPGGSPTSSIISKKLAAEFDILCINSHGESSSFVVPKTAFYNELGFSMRDVRFQHSNMINVRDQKVVMRFQDLKAVVCTDAVLLIDFRSRDKLSSLEIERFCKELPMLLTGDELNARDLPFEYRAIESLLSFNISKLTTTLAELEPDITKILNALTDPSKPVVDRSLVHVLLQKSAKLNEFGTSVREFIEALEEWLESDDDIRDLCISIDPREGSDRTSYNAHIFHKASAEERDEPYHQHINFDRTINLQDEMELLLESFIKNAEEIRNRVSVLLSAIENSNNAILINLDSHRNWLLRLEIQLTIGMFSCTVFSMIGMAFGMNLTSHFEEHYAAFWVATGAMMGGTAIVWKLLLRYLDQAPKAKQSALLSSLVSKTQQINMEREVELGKELEQMKQRSKADSNNNSSSKLDYGIQQLRRSTSRGSAQHQIDQHPVPGTIRRMRPVDAVDLRRSRDTRSTTNRMEALERSVIGKEEKK